jgi:oligopeptide/dipeptide ABC transporter ATP-binding protein
VSAPYAVRVSCLTVVATRVDSSPIPLVEGVDLAVGRQEVMGIVGETGSGKTLTMKAMLGLLPPGTRGTGRIWVGEDVQGFDLAVPESMRPIRGHAIGVVLQNPVGMFDPLVKVKRQLVEGVLARKLMTRERASTRARELLSAMGFRDAEAVLELYPHQLSGGMSQRAAMAMALMPHPEVIIADEPTSALDAHLRLDVLEILRQLAKEQHSAVLLVSHDLGLVSNFCDSIAVMYAGRIVEHGSSKAVLESPQHPYTEALLRCSPALDAEPRAELRVIGGAPPPPGSWPSGCVFEPRCPLAFGRCRTERPVLRAHGARSAACHLAFPGSA